MPACFLGFHHDDKELNLCELSQLNVFFLRLAVVFVFKPQNKDNKQEDKKNGNLENVCHLKGIFMGCQLVCLLKNNIKEPCSNRNIFFIIVSRFTPGSLVGCNLDLKGGYHIINCI